jgi:hypothetical protein
MTHAKNMSNVTQDPRDSGDNRRRRSRGGQNRRNNNQDRRGGERGSGQGGGRQQGRNPQGQGRSEEFRPQGGGSRPARKYSAPKLTLWQKILKAVGLYKEPVRPARPERKADPAKPAAEARVKSNTRNARTQEKDAAPQGQGKARREGNRERNTRGGDRDSVESARVYVGNLSYDVSESDLQDLFKGIGGVRNVEIVYNRSTHRSKGYGFVEMLHIDEAKRSVEVLHDQPFMGRKLTVSGAKSKGQDEREDKEDRPERKPRPVQVAVAPAAVAPVAAPVETVTNLAEPYAQEVVAAVENVEAVGAPPVIVEAVEHHVADAVEGDFTPSESVEKKDEIA